MKAEQVDQALRDKFLDHGACLVFWHDPNGIYRTGERPPVEEDGLFDIRLYSTEFHADVASI